MFEVIWMPEAQAELEEVWRRTGDRDAILLAVWAIEAALRDNPAVVGESRPDEQRVTFARPLGVRFRVFADAGRVNIGSVWYFRSQ